AESCRATDAAGECVGRIVVDEHPETGHSVRVQHPTTPLPIADGDQGALAAWELGIDFGTWWNGHPQHHRSAHRAA
ncbi:MAG: hypothetical protein ACRDRF_22600, partial [Pseudonocardiaceae bacterium]